MWEEEVAAATAKEEEEKDGAATKQKARQDREAGEETRVGRRGEEPMLMLPLNLL